MSSFNLDEHLERELTKSGWKQVKKGSVSFYERPLSKRTYERMVHPRKAGISKRKRGMQAVKRLINRWFL
jgi:hypothetical protein